MKKRKKLPSRKESKPKLIGLYYKYLLLCKSYQI